VTNGVSRQGAEEDGWS